MPNTVAGILNDLTTPLGGCHYSLLSEDEEIEK